MFYLIPFKLFPDEKFYINQGFIKTAKIYYIPKPYF